MEVLVEVQDFISRVLSARKESQEGEAEMPNIRAKVSSCSVFFFFFFFFKTWYTLVASGESKQVHSDPPAFIVEECFGPADASAISKRSTGFK